MVLNYMLVKRRWVAVVCLSSSVDESLLLLLLLLLLSSSSCRTQRRATGVRTSRIRPTGRRCSRLPKTLLRWRGRQRGGRRRFHRGLSDWMCLWAPAGLTDTLFVVFLVVSWHRRHRQRLSRDKVTPSCTQTEKQSECTGQHGVIGNKCLENKD